VDQLYLKGEKFYKGYCDDPRNTDNAWLEIIVCNYHDNDYAVSHSIKEVLSLYVACDFYTVFRKKDHLVSCLFTRKLTSLNKSEDLRHYVADGVLISAYPGRYLPQ